MLRLILPSLAVAFNPCRRGEVYISHSRRCVSAPDIDYLQRQNRQYDTTYESYNAYADNNNCDDGYEWDEYDSQCYDIDECTRETHDCNTQTQACHNMDGTFNCICAPGYEIKTDTNSLTEEWDFDEEHVIGECVDIDECQSQCQGAGQKCQNNAGSFDCTCETGYERSPHGALFSCRDIDECASDPCGAHESCRNLDGSHECVCYKDHVRNSAGICTAESPCQTKGQICQWKCHDLEDLFQCECPEGYALIGNMCLDINECAEGIDTCSDSELCLNINGGYICNDFAACPAGFDPIRGWVDEFNRVKQDTNICHRSSHCEAGEPQCNYNIIVNYATDLLSNNNASGKRKGTKLYRFVTTARYGSSATYGYKIVDVKDGQNVKVGQRVGGESVLHKEEFSINQRYSSRPRAYLMAMKPIVYSEGENDRRDLEIEYFAKHRRSGRILYQELIKVRVFISKYEF